MDRYEYVLLLEKFLKIAAVLGSEQALELIRYLVITRPYPIVAASIMEMPQLIEILRDDKPGYFRKVRKDLKIRRRVGVSYSRSGRGSVQFNGITISYKVHPPRLKTRIEEIMSAEDSEFFPFVKREREKLSSSA